VLETKSQFNQLFLMTIYLFLAGILSFILTYFTRKVAIKKAIIDMPNERSSHTIPTPRGGGIAIALTWFLSVSFLFYIGSIESKLFLALISGLLLSIISLLDDIYTLKNKPRLLIQVLVAGLGLYFVGGFNQVDLGFVVITNSYILNFLAFISIVWFINLFNFIDGIDGYASSQSIFVVASLYFFTGESFLLFLMMAIVGFLPWNWDKAKIFMGDVGSTLLGYTIVILLFYFHDKVQLSIFEGLIITSLFWFDATYTLIRRFINKENIGQAHRKHAYQRMVQYGFSHQKTVLFGMGINLILFFIVLSTKQMRVLDILGLLVSILLLFTIMVFINKKKAF
jgi:UDP-N-acetylmuramyl pentapeptide phosphotransferase/UDP-N-acetylglucosamine-1-phosphate transferase